MGWCSGGGPGTYGEQCSRDECDQAGGTYSETHDGGCGGSKLLSDPFAVEVVDSAVWPPIQKVRAAVLPMRRAGRTMLADFDQHFAEIVRIMGRDPNLLMDVVRFSAAMGPYLRAMSGETMPADESLAARTSSRLRPGMVEWAADLLKRFDAKASGDLKVTVKRYVAVLPQLQNLTPRELLSTLDDPRIVSRLQGV